jgi:hypothetical protein
VARWSISRNLSCKLRVLCTRCNCSYSADRIPHIDCLIEPVLGLSTFLATPLFGTGWFPLSPVTSCPCQELKRYCSCTVAATWTCEAYSLSLDPDTIPANVYGQSLHSMLQSECRRFLLRFITASCIGESTIRLVYSCHANVTLTMHVITCSHLGHVP